MSTEKQEAAPVVISLSTTDSGPTYPNTKVNTSGGWVTFGDKNLFPQDIIRYNGKSPVNAAIVDSTVTYICGKGIRDSNLSEKGTVGVPNRGESWDQITERVAKDYKIFGGYYLQIIVNKGSTTVSVFHQDFSEVRVGKINEKGKPLTFRIAHDWTKISGKNKPIELPVWPGSINEAEKGVAYLYYHWDYTPGLKLYSIPGWYAALEYVKADGTLGSFYNNSIDNGFTPSVVISMPSNPEDAKKEEFQKKFERVFTGAKGASSVVMLWGEADVRPTITPFSAAANADIYNNVEAIVFQKIISAHRLASPTLAGVSGSGNLSGNAAEIIDAYVLYNYTVIEKMRRTILDSLNIFTKINGTSALRIDELDVLPKIQESEVTRTENKAKKAI